jgi:GDP-D-mannose 3', 5'-epimerase
MLSMKTSKRAVVLGAGGFIGGHLVTRLKHDGYWVRGVDIKRHEFKETDADEFIIADLRNYSSVELVIDDTIDEVYQLAADMGGAQFVFTKENDSDIIHNSALINLHVAKVCVDKNVRKVLYTSSACMYPAYNQEEPDNPKCSENSAYPAAPDSVYGWEKLFSEIVFDAFSRNKGLVAKIARLHNVMGPYGTWNGGREKAPAALCRKVIMAKNGSEIEVFGDGQQTRSFLYVDECVEGLRRLMDSENFHGPVNIGSEEMITINELAKMIIKISGKDIHIKNIEGPVGVRGRNSDNKLIYENLQWKPTMSLHDGISKVYNWIASINVKK